MTLWRAILLLFGWLAVAAQAAPIGTVTIEVTPYPAATFIPAQALGAGVDGLERGDVAQVYTPANLRAMSGVGYTPLTYRLRTELGVETWHWNPQGVWSDPSHKQGYWTGNSAAAGLISITNGYRLPRRGSTTDQANNDGYSRLDDGDTHTCWKSNPYLDAHFTGENNALHPQWIVIDLGRKRPVDTLQVAWAAPYATRYAVQYWVGQDNPDDGLDQTYEAGTYWATFPNGLVTHGIGSVHLRLTARPIIARFIRLWLTESSEKPPHGATDVRDGLGYAITELGVGDMDGRGLFHDWVRHAPRHDDQTEIYASSSDPWHRANTADPNTEQPGFDHVFRSPLTHGVPVLIPVGLLYDTPDNAAAELRFLKARGYPIRGVEMGEEPDGQSMTPEDYGALYVQWAEALHRVDPTLKLGGPCFQTNTDAWTTWPDASGNGSWMNRFLRYLKRRGHSGDFNFFSFEWYPFDDVCAPPPGQLLQEPGLLAHALTQLRREGLPKTLPVYITEYGYSSFAGQAEMDMPGALLNADIVGQFLTLGGTAAYLYGLEPNTPIHEVSGCPSYGNLAVFLSDDARHIKQPLATWYGARLLMREWAEPASLQPHQVYRVLSDVRNAQGQSLVTAYAVHRPDGQWALLLINKDPKHAHPIHLRFRMTETGPSETWRGPKTVLQYSSAQYIWHPNGEHGFASRDLPPVLKAIAEDMVTLPPYSLTIVRGRLTQK